VRDDSDVWALLDWIALDLGMLHLGGPAAFYDQPTSESIDSLAWMITRGEMPELSTAPACHATLVNVWNASRPKKGGGGGHERVDVLSAFRNASGGR
jgi:hypothetical protein